ncbi:ICMT-domain-containing protein [Trametes coccinea BRFM310]|uniref:Protein-S-isoprenylcysteine O-methyltransferase n=1 Tax=Trametes coccinea (strain BRFM310) TaxID=1353009 RepID=A0A1Y2IDU4_TRAC3|nr:ICMT-domain-containing protein [Trametes coccinea BRFM310]
MASSLATVKLPAHIAAVIAEYVSFLSPNPPPKKEEAQKYNGGDLISKIATAGSYFALAFAWSIHGCEIAAILAQQTRSPSSSAILSLLFSRPPAASKLSLHPTFLLGASLLLFGAAIRKACYTTLGRYFTFQLAILKQHKLVTWGPYAVVRHPSYTGMLASIAGVLLMQLSPGSWLALSGVLDTRLGRTVIGVWTVWNVLLMIGFVRRVPKEDAVLRKEFGAQWEEWARKVPYTLIPYVW